MRKHLWLTLLLAPLAAAACKDEPSPPPPDRADTNMSGETQRKMANCPSAVAGAVTRVELTRGGADVTVTAPSPEAAREITSLARLHTSNRGLPVIRIHNGGGNGGARTGYCPTVHDGASLTAITVPGGVRFQLRASTPQDVKDLQLRVSERAARLREHPSMFPSS